MKKFITFIQFFLVVQLAGCSTVGLGISLPLTPFANVGVNLNSAGNVSGNISTHIGGATISGTASAP